MVLGELKGAVAVCGSGKVEGAAAVGAERSEGKHNRQAVQNTAPSGRKVRWELSRHPTYKTVQYTCSYKVQAIGTNSGWHGEFTVN